MTPELLTLVFERFLEKHGLSESSSAVHSYMLDDLDCFFQQGADYAAWIDIFTPISIRNQLYYLVNHNEVELLDVTADEWVDGITNMYWQVFTDMVNTMTNPDRPFEEILNAVVQKRWEEIATLSGGRSQR